MLPAGLTADPVPPAERALLKRLHPSASTVAHLLVGACSCDLVRTRQATHIEDEREHRRRYQIKKLPRGEIIRLLERHRRGPVPRPTLPGGWPRALAAFVAEHARNAGPTLYLLGFSPPDPSPHGKPPALAHRTVKEIDASGVWLVEDQPVIVS